MLKQTNGFSRALRWGSRGVCDVGAAGCTATFEDLRAQASTLGSGVVMVFDETRDIRQSLKELGHFFAHESCGKCYPCQMGTQRQKEILERVAVTRAA
jgi:NADH:ubiquinone oxidoreductase subunit F (NADH-binding)